MRLFWLFWITWATLTLIYLINTHAETPGTKKQRNKRGKHRESILFIWRAKS